MTAEDDEYVSVMGLIHEIRDGAVLFSVGDAVQGGDWIPRSLMHGADDLRLKTQLAKGDRAILRIFRWKAEEVGFITERDTETSDLFDDTKPLG
jgi:hypothetical protein